MPVPEEILSLVRQFDERRKTISAGYFSEARLRRSFVEPMLRILGWDIDNRQGLPEDEREVILSDSPSYTGTLKAPDYCFRIDGSPKFYLEAKKPFADIKHGIRPAYQLRRFAWSANLLFSIFTDFEEFSVYDCRIRPHKDDRASRARVLYLKYDQYPERWQDIASLFSKYVLRLSSFEDHLEPKQKKHGTIEVGESLSGDYEHWRDQLAHNIAAKNKDLSHREQSAAARRIVKRIIFLKICEDRGIEPFGQLRNLLEGGDINSRLGELCGQVLERNKSCLPNFGMENDMSAHDVIIEDRLLNHVIESLYYPESPYEFSVMPDEVIGRILARDEVA
jgi:hypothetical protein